jgi:GDP-L-fucose synthase
MPKRILITGASGFIGKNIVEHLTRDHSDKYEFYSPRHKDLDLLDTEKVEKFIEMNRINLIIHCANIGGSRKTNYDAGRTDIVASNLRMFFNLARCMDNIEKMVHFGSGAEYDMRHYKPKMKEEYFGAHVPEDPYGFSKYVISKYIENAEKIVCLRLFGVFGKYEDHEYKFISNAIVKDLFHLPITINQNVNFDFLYVKDLLRIVDHLLTHNMKHKAYNAASGRTIDLVSIAKMINSVSDKPSKIIIKKPGLNIEYSADNKRLLREIKGLKFTPMDSAIRELYAHYRSLLGKIDRKTIKNDGYINYCRSK